MKNSIKMLPVLLFSGVCSLAQAQITSPSKPMAGRAHHSKMAHDCCMMKDGKMMMMQGGKMMPMTRNMTMRDGTVCTTEGQCIKKDGTKMTMTNGQCMMMDGKMTTMDAMKKNGKKKSDAKMGTMKM